MLCVLQEHLDEVLGQWERYENLLNEVDDYLQDVNTWLTQPQQQSTTAACSLEDAQDKQTTAKVRIVSRLFSKSHKKKKIKVHSYYSQKLIVFRISNRGFPAQIKFLFIIMINMQISPSLNYL